MVISDAVIIKDDLRERSNGSALMRVLKGREWMKKKKKLTDNCHQGMTFNWGYNLLLLGTVGKSFVLVFIRASAVLF